MVVFLSTKTLPKIVGFIDKFCAFLSDLLWFLLGDLYSSHAVFTSRPRALLALTPLKIKSSEEIRKLCQRGSPVTSSSSPVVDKFHFSIVFRWKTVEIIFRWKFQYSPGHLGGMFFSQTFFGWLSKKLPQNTNIFDSTIACFSSA